VSRERRKAYVFRGAKIDKVRECHVNVYDYNTREWSREPFGPGSVDPKVTSNGGSVACVINDRLYMFGGWEKGHLNNHVYELNLETYVWALLKAVSDHNQPLRKYKCGVVPYGEDMLCVFGGYGYPADFMVQDGARYDWEDRSVGWTNELHLFHLKDRVWLVPTVTGTPPNPCAAFTFHYIDRHRVLLFGGRQKAERVNEIHILDLANWVSVWLDLTIIYSWYYNTLRRIRLMI
jgi:N-acetylneuraminic acid mutarotase